MQTQRQKCYPPSPVYDTELATPPLKRPIAPTRPRQPARAAAAQQLREQGEEERGEQPRGVIMRS